MAQLLFEASVAAALALSSCSMQLMLPTWHLSSQPGIEPSSPALKVASQPLGHQGSPSNHRLLNVAAPPDSAADEGQAPFYT